MISPPERAAIGIFECHDEAVRQCFAERIADIRLQPGEWWMREGEEASFFALLATGDVRHDSIKRASSGVGEGRMVIAFLHQYLALKNF